MHTNVRDSQMAHQELQNPIHLLRLLYTKVGL